MGMRFRKSKKIAPGVRLNLSAKSASISIGPKGFKKTFSTSGRVTTTVGIPGTGLSYSTWARLLPDPPFRRRLLPSWWLPAKTSG